MQSIRMRVFLAIVITLFATEPAFAARTSIFQDFNFLSDSTTAILEEAVQTMYPPWLYELNLKPGNPKAGEPVLITANIHNDRAKFNADVTEAYIAFSIDGGKTWDRADMEQDMNPEVWFAELPGQKAGVDVQFYIVAEDSSKNLYAGMPCLVRGDWPPFDDPCLAPMSVDDSLPINDPSNLVPDDLDILETKFGEGPEDFYYQLRVDGKISSGKATPTDIYAYGAAILNEDRRAGDVIGMGYIIAYAPLAKLASADPCLLAYQKAPGAFYYGPDNVLCAVDGSRLMIRLRKDAIGKNPSQYIKLLSATARILNLSEAQGKEADYTRFTTFHRVMHSFTVGN